MNLHFTHQFQYAPAEAGSFYYSINGQSPKVNFEEATVRGQAPDKGLYFPENIPSLSPELINNLNLYSKAELGFRIMKPYVSGTIPDDVLQNIISETVNFDFPLVKLNEDMYSLELFHGPTLAFKDVGARFMSRCLGYFNRNKSQPTTVLVATSGDTGGAVANGFLGVEGVEVVILYPSGKVSPVQELQLTTCGQNITALEVNGNFDACQLMVKQAFADQDLQSKRSLTSANSINVARWLPQQLYYFFAVQQWNQEEPPVFSIPSGNFGNICAGILAHVSGLPVTHFIAACNANDVVPEFFKSGKYKAKPAVATISNAMDVGDPSNFIRILELFKNDAAGLSTVLSSISVDDATTKKTMKQVYDQFDYTLDPHGAVAYYALEKFLQRKNATAVPGKGSKGIFLETAHPVKFPETVEAITNKEIPVPESTQHLFSRKKHSIPMEADFAVLKDWLMS